MVHAAPQSLKLLCSCGTFALMLGGFSLQSFVPLKRLIRSTMFPCDLMAFTAFTSRLQSMLYSTVSVLKI